MRKVSVFTLIITALATVLAAFKNSSEPELYLSVYNNQLEQFDNSQLTLLTAINRADLQNEADISNIRKLILQARMEMKGMDFWFRYLEPLAYKKINSPLPVEWETEVFEKFEAPYKREGAGLMLAYLYLDEEGATKDSLASLVRQSVEASKVYAADSITSQLTDYHHFYLCNRLYLLNLAAIYTTGFECPDGAAVVPELRRMMNKVDGIYQAFNKSYPATALTDEYMLRYKSALAFVQAQPDDNTAFDHYTFLREYVNPLFTMNQELVGKYKVVTKSLVDYSLSKTARSIFDKALYRGQNPKGIFLRVQDSATLAEIDRVGKELFYDPVLSGNNMRSCASCHKPTEHFTDTMVTASVQFDRAAGALARNTPTLLNAEYNHLLMMDGKHTTLQNQVKDVVHNAVEMNCSDKDALSKILSCKEYKQGFAKLLKYTPQEKEVTFEHVSSAITYYYAKFSKYYSPFDEAMEHRGELTESAKKGFNLFMGKAQCATCHFVPQFNGVKPPYIGSEFEVLGTPTDTGYHKLSVDRGRHAVNPAQETMNAFRTGTVRNSAYTKPYMHNGVFNTLEQVVDFYNDGGGAGHGLNVPNQTLAADSLKLTRDEKSQLISFIRSLNEEVQFELPPATLPSSNMKALNSRKVGGVY
ncbi:cytochrome-c peroxidase [Polluticoccus soli]|uniref:cytochrome-c peroxidase n=1 Tax=Polluticoccus soli TaxID=3034150 RepID=UPI0023E21F38|nr:cytochrome c peroxidase [Flavipsychrobacter sp. JY13-12]